MEGDGPCDERRPKKERWDEYGIINTTTHAEGSGESDSRVEWKSFGSGSGASGKEPAGSEGRGSLSSDEGISEGCGAYEESYEKHGSRSLISSLRESVSRNIRRASGMDKENLPSKSTFVEKKDVCSGGELNISKQRYFEHMRRSKTTRGESEDEDEREEVSEAGIEERSKKQERKAEREENMRRAIKSQETDLRSKDQEILLLRQKISRLESAMEIKGKRYIKECIERGETAVRMLEEEMKRERNMLLKRIEEEIETSKMLMKRNEGLKKIINELVRKIKRAKRVTGSG